MKQTGIVMEVGRKSVIVFTDSGEFKKLPYYGNVPTIGDEIPLELNHKRHGFTNLLVKYGTIAAVFLMAMFIPLMSGLFSPKANETVAYVSVDINPSIEMGIDANEEVVFAKACNKDAEKLLGNMDLEGQKIQAAVRVITDAAIDAGFIASAKKNTVVVAIAPIAKQNIDKHLETSLVASAQASLSDKQMGGMVEAFKTDSKIHTAAESKGLSIGKYALLLEAQDTGVNVSVDDMRTMSITDAIEKGGGNTVALLEKAKEDSTTADITGSTTLANQNQPGKVQVLAQPHSGEAGNGVTTNIDTTDDKTIADNGNKGDTNGSTGSLVEPKADRNQVISLKPTVGEGSVPSIVNPTPKPTEGGETKPVEKPDTPPVSSTEPAGDIIDQVPGESKGPQKVIDTVYKERIK